MDKNKYLIETSKKVFETVILSTETEMENWNNTSLQAVPDQIPKTEHILLDKKVMMLTKATLEQLVSIESASSNNENNPLSWQDDALCAQTDPEAFFPDRNDSTKNARKVCTKCIVTAECLFYALSNDEEFGIWGGLSRKERDSLEKRSY